MEHRNVLSFLEWPPLNPMEDSLDGVERENRMLHVHRKCYEFSKKHIKIMGTSFEYSP